MLSSDNATQDLVNDASAPQWHALSPSAAAREAIQAATTVDKKVEGLAARAVQATLASDRVGLVARSLHRARHLDEIERGFWPLSSSTV